jgi:hypothetical protein
MFNHSEILTIALTSRGLARSPLPANLKSDWACSWASIIVTLCIVTAVHGAFLSLAGPSIPSTIGMHALRICHSNDKKYHIKSGKGGERAKTRLSNSSHRRYQVTESLRWVDIERTVPWQVKSLIDSLSLAASNPTRRWAKWPSLMKALQ